MANDEMQKWCVTYTKHVNQKRKIYQDGSLHFHTSSHKAKLFDDCQKLIEIKILKKEEVVKSGEMLTFNAHLVDVGDPEGGHKHVSKVNCLGNDMKNIQKPGLPHSKKFKAVFVGKTIGSMDRNRAMCGNLSPSQKIVREFMKSEQNKYRAVLSSPDAIKSDLTEWQILYTTQVTQKAKKYHDGFLRLTFGSQRRQVMLYDEHRTLLNSRYLKIDEVVKSGESLRFDAHLVDIGEPEGNHISSMDSNVQGKNCNESRQAELKKNELNKCRATQISPVTTEFGISEWQAFYTTQITQKAKKYHDGILRLTFCGSQGKQIMLYDASRSLLDTRFLRKNEVIISGESLAFDAHLVDIGKLLNRLSSEELNAEANKLNEVKQAAILYEQETCLPADKDVVRKWHALYTAQITQKTKKYISGILRLALIGTRLVQVTLLSEDGITLSSKHLKSSEEIKSGSTLLLPKYLVDVGDPWISREGNSQDNASYGNNLDSSFGRSKIGEVKVQSSILAKKPLQNGISQEHTYLGKDLDSSVGTSTIGAINVNNSGSVHKPLRNASAILSILKSFKPQETDTITRKANVEQCSASQSSNLVHFDRPDQDTKKTMDILEEHVNDFEALDKGTPVREDLLCGFIKLEDSEDTRELQSFSLRVYKKKINEELATSRNLDEGPSFDLGF